MTTWPLTDHRFVLYNLIMVTDALLRGCRHPRKFLHLRTACGILATLALLFIAVAFCVPAENEAAFGAIFLLLLVAPVLIAMTIIAMLAMALVLRLLLGGFGPPFRSWLVTASAAPVSIGALYCWASAPKTWF